MTSPLLFALGALTLWAFFVHVVMGGREIARPMLGADFDLTARRVLWVCWHAISAELLLGGAVLVAAGFVAASETSTALVRAVATVHLIEGLLFLAIIAVSAKALPKAWLKMPQWMLFLPTGALAWWATL